MITDTAAAIIAGVDIAEYDAFIDGELARASGRTVTVLNTTTKGAPTVALNSGFVKRHDAAIKNTTSANKRARRLSVE